MLRATFLNQRSMVGVDFRRLVQRVKRHEGTGPMRNGRFLPYRDTVGKTTIGYGRNLTDRGISADEADDLLEADLDAAVEILAAALPWTGLLDECRQRALVEMVFNMGIGNTKRGLLSFRKALEALKDEEYQIAAEHFRQSKWASQVGPTRSGALTFMIEFGEDPD